MESSITCLINDERSSYGLQPVAPNADLRQAALSHSNEMISQGYFEHTSPAGLTFMDRIEATGYMRAPGAGPSARTSSGALGRSARRRPWSAPG